MSMDASGDAVKISAPIRRPTWQPATSLVAAVLAVALPCLILLTAMAQPQPAGAAGPTITGTGSSYAAVALNQWEAQVGSPPLSLSVNYATTSSVLGLNNFAQYPLVDFGASEIGYSTGQASQQPAAGFAYQYLPDVAGATCLMYNLQDTLGNGISNLKLNSAVMAGMFDGSIGKWNDPSIAALNPGVLLPSTPIVVVYRTDASGDNYIFSDYLQALQPGVWSAFTAAVGSPPGAQAVWPIPQNGARSVGPYNFGNWSGESGSDNASNYVYGNPGSITYVETAYAKLHNDPCASVQNASNNYIQPSGLADALALTSDQLQPDLEQNLGPVFTSGQPQAYPISAYSYLVMAEKAEIPAAKQQEEADFVQFIACKGQQSADALGYSPLPPNLVQADYDAIGRITGTPLPAPTAANCDNPYLTGQLQLVGGPVIGGAPAAAGAAGAAVVAPTAAPTATSAGAAGAAGAATVSPAAAKAAAAKAAAAAAAARRREANAVSAPPGQRAGVALQSATGALLSAESPTAVVLAAALGFLALITLPPLIAASKRRRATIAAAEPEEL
jgi:phosphate transport system substrate-binding protein